MPLRLLSQRFAANIQALARCRLDWATTLQALAPSRPYFLSTEGEQVRLGVAAATGGVDPLPSIMPPAAAMRLAAQLCPSGNYDKPILVVGEDVGWLWNAFHRLPCRCDSAPGHRPALHLACVDWERLWAMLHVQDWASLLADSRVRLYAGPDAFTQLRAALSDDTMCPWPKAAVTIDPNFWPAGVTFDSLQRDVHLERAARLTPLLEQLKKHNPDADALAQRLRGGERLRILGVTSRYTTFLQHSMRDWLAAFEALGHATRLVIEQSDHELPSALAYASACAEFEPDLIVVIDHFRKEIPGLPENTPVVMWVQDALPNLFCREAGAAQGPRDFSLGFAKRKMVLEFDYPAERYLAALVPVNEARFAPRPLAADEIERHRCDVSFVSHASAPAERLVREEIARLRSPEAARLFSDVYEQLNVIYEAGGVVTEPIHIRRIVEQSMNDTRVSLPEAQMPALLEFFTQRVNNALFRHQSLQWLAEMGVNLHLYGRGWETHPTLGRFARGVADNANQLRIIYQASRINLHVSPHGGAHQRVLEALAAGGFCMIRHCSGDVMERDFSAIWNWCESHGVMSDGELHRRADADTRGRLTRVAEILQYDPLGDGDSFIETLRCSHESGYVRSAGMIWGDDYDAVNFDSADELKTRVSRFLSDESERRRRIDSMRRPMLERFTYRATTQRLLQFIADGLATESQRSTRTAA